MLKKLTVSVVGVLFLVSPLAASAQTASVQAQIDALLQQISQLQALIAALKTQQGNSSDPTQSPGHEASPCVSLTQALTLGSADATTGGEVSKLQTFLMGQGTINDPIYPERLVTGYFGPATSRAVQKWQTARGITLTTVGVAVVGPKTRAAMACPSM
jgi:peptidoglycan hydrolase-like protein with peptidoglycan-binding domain